MTTMSTRQKAIQRSESWGRKGGDGEGEVDEKAVEIGDEYSLHSSSIKVSMMQMSEVHAVVAV